MSSKNDSAFTISAGTTISVTDWTSSGTSTNYAYGQINFRPKKSPKPKVKIRDIPKRDFWDGVKWKEFIAYAPRKSITGKWIIGPMYKRWRTPPVKHRGVGLGNFKQYASKKELFQEKLKGNA